MSHPYSPNGVKPMHPLHPNARECSVFCVGLRAYIFLHPLASGLSTFLPLNGGTLTPWKLLDTLGQCFHRILETDLLSLQML